MQHGTRCHTGHAARHVDGVEGELEPEIETSVEGSAPIRSGMLRDVCLRAGPLSQL